MRRIFLLSAILALALSSSAGAAQRQVPQGFFGVMVDGVMMDRTPAGLQREFDVMAANGVETVRYVIYWADLQPNKAGDVPAGWVSGRNGVPTDVSITDRFFEQAARHGMRVIPVVLRSPKWASENPKLYAAPPSDDDAYAAFLGTLVDRYGPSGSFWAEHADVPRRPQRSWQIWNEPNIDRYWASPKPFERHYVRLLRTARKTIKATDPGAKIILCGFANDSWRPFARAYRAGIRPYFDVAAVHPFSGKLSNVIKIVRLNREVMAKYGDRAKRLEISELTWPSAKGKTKNHVGWETTEQGQAERLRAAFRALTKKRTAWKLDSLIWSTWLTPDDRSNNSFDWSGLRKLNWSDPYGEPISKPALQAFRDSTLPLEGRG